MTRLCCWGFFCVVTLCGTVATAQPAGGPRNAPQRQPGPSAEDILKLLIPPEDSFQDYDNTGEYERRPARAAQRRVPSADAVAEMTPQQQRRLLRQAVVNLEEQLDKLPEEDAADWKTFLQLESLGASLWGQNTAAPDRTTRQILDQIAEQLDAVKEGSEYARISNLWGFKVADIALPVYSQSPVEKQKKQLSASSSQFDKALRRVNYGAGWKKHLQSDEVKRLASKSEQYNSSDQEILQKIKALFSEVEKDEKYKKVASLHGFSETNESLRALIEAIKAERQEAQHASVIKAIKLSHDATSAERNIVATLKQLAKIKAACRAEGKAKVQAAMSQKTLASAGEGDKQRLARKANQANEVLRLAKDRHDKSMLAVETNLYKMLRLIKAGRQAARGDETVYVLPLEDTAWVLPLDDPDAVHVMPPEPRVLPPETRVLPPEEKVLPPEPGVLPPEPGVLPPEPGVLPPEPGVLPPEPGVLPPEDGQDEEPAEVLPLEDSDSKEDKEDEAEDTKVLGAE